MRKTVAIIHYNTPELTMAAIGSLLKNGGGPFRVVVFDNSDARPFEGATNVTVIDNTRGQVIDFDKELEKYPERDRSIGCAKGCEFGSVKHMMTVQKLWELLPQGFVLMESDILIKKNIDEFFNEQYSVYGYCQKSQPHNPFGIGRMLPMLCWMNVPMLKREGAKYFDPTRTYGLLPGGRANRNNWYDTGAVLLEDILQKRPRLKGFHRDIREFVEHYGSGSWQHNDLDRQMRWLMQHKNLLPTEDENVKLPLPTGKVAVCAIGRMENRYAVEWVEHYNSLGVDKIFIYDNNRVEDGELFADVLQPYIEAGFVEITYFDGLQKDAYEKCYRDHSGDYEWIGFFDFDELVCIEDGRDIQNFLMDYDADVVSMNWMTMTDSGLTRYDERPMAERFTQGTGEDFEINRHVKSFVRSGINGISFNDPHIPNAPVLQCEDVLHERIEQIPVQPKVIHGVAYIKHYNTKTAEEWATLKMRRLSPCGDEYNREMKAKNVKYFFSINERTPEKEEILKVLSHPSFDESQGTPIPEISKPKQGKTKNSKKLK
jgi:hypothetical protein